ncbi:MAG: LacI family transcriptional regulator [Luteococcus sp.]|uniref:LacI family DNA-binding transcriptional regulator n=1 Tax=Luteococcus sp. TaxID=1969402 RepID=UPI0026470481|nr:LacI family DNA-binding transcriptional regulator [Luteococcus sp.]MDN5564174.1 LacI family transcriptional regulator [Luteococcus sp.]
MARRVTSHDVAALAGVSRSAVSLVLNGRAEGVISAENQAAVRAAAKELGYRPNGIARSLRSAATHTIGVITDSIASGTYGGAMISGATDVAARKGYLLLAIDSHQDRELEVEAVDMLRARQCDALLFAAEGLHSWQPPESFLAEKCLLLNAFDPQGRVAGVVGDEEVGGRRATELLLEAGHRRITYLTGTDEVIANGRRITGHREAIERSGAHSTLVPCGWEIDAGLETGTRVLDVAEPPTAIMCANDRVAAGVFLAAARLGLRIPEDLSVVGYDDDPNVAPQLGLSTVLLPHRAMGERAASLLLEALDGKELPTGEIPVDSPMVRRESVAAPRS